MKIVEIQYVNFLVNEIIEQNFQALLYAIHQYRYLYQEKISYGLNWF